MVDTSLDPDEGVNEASGGGGGIRTHGALSDTRDFQSRPLGLYGTPPKLWKSS